LINQLLQDEILPHSEEQASTAVAVEISWNESDDPKLLYQAVVHGISRDELEKELKELYEDVEFLKSGHIVEDNKENDEEDLEIQARVNDTLSKLKCLYSDIKSLEDLNRTTINELLNRSCCKLLGQTKKFQTHDVVKFARFIKGFIDTSKSKDGAVTQVSVWPLVKVVKLQCKAPILKNCITLVDLPGSQDTSAARVKIAEDYQKNLTVTCVVSPSVRAASDKEAQHLVGRSVRRKMQLDGLYTSESLFYVVTKTDDLVDVNTYIRDHPNIKPNLLEDVNRVFQDEKCIKDFDLDEKETNKILKKTEKLIRKLAGEINKLEAQEQAFRSTLSPPQSRKHGINDTKGKSATYSHLHVI
jgi:hypothetical protein